MYRAKEYTEWCKSHLTVDVEQEKVRTHSNFMKHCA
jgi:hypothetical protein